MKNLCTHTVSVWLQKVGEIPMLYLLSSVLNFEIQAEPMRNLPAFDRISNSATALGMMYCVVYWWLVIAALLQCCRARRPFEVPTVTRVLGVAPRRPMGPKVERVGHLTGGR
jgi:hypothetical protein